MNPTPFWLDLLHGTIAEALEIARARNLPKTAQALEMAAAALRQEAPLGDS